MDAWHPLGMATGGHFGAYLHVDLTTGEATRRALSPETLRAFIGGSGLGTWLLMKHAPAGVDPAAPEAALVVALSPLVGTPLTTSAKFAVVSKSPLTNRINDALCSDRFAIEAKRCGVDAIVLTGACPTWSVLVIDEGEVRVEAADGHLGRSSLDTEEALRAEHGERFRFLGIGPAGERQVRYATASGDGRHAGRGGTGAVFGSKRLKGLLVRGSTPVPLADRAAVLALAKDLSQRSMGAATAKYRELGTVANVLVMNRLGALPTRNFQSGAFDGAEALSGEALHADPEKIRKHCAACTIGCEHVFQSAKGGVRLEYEGIFALGPLLGIKDREGVIEAARRCDAHGMDVISTGGTIAFAMEARERGLLPEAPVFGDVPGALALIDDIGARRGLGDLLAEGTRHAAAAIGDDAPDFACHVKGLELPGYEPRALTAMAVGLATGARGADHNRSGAYEADFAEKSNRLAPDPAKGAAAAESETRAAIIDSLILCKFLRGMFDDLPAEAAALLSAVTGHEFDGDAIEACGRRIVTLKKLFNVREGWRRDEDTLPPRFLEEDLRQDDEAGASSRGARLRREDLDRMIHSYYRARGWDDEGRVPEAELRALGLLDLVS